MENQEPPNSQIMPKDFNHLALILQIYDAINFGSTIKELAEEAQEYESTITEYLYEAEALVMRPNLLFKPNEYDVTDKQKDGFYDAFKLRQSKKAEKAVKCYCVWFNLEKGGVLRIYCLAQNPDNALEKSQDHLKGYDKVKLDKIEAIVSPFQTIDNHNKELIVHTITTDETSAEVI